MASEPPPLTLGRLYNKGDCVLRNIRSGGLRAGWLGWLREAKSMEVTGEGPGYGEKKCEEVQRVSKQSE